jgi:nicotinamide-nucleotide amidase
MQLAATATREAPTSRARRTNVASYLEAHHLVLVTAESCTAGLIASRLADMPGAGGVLEGAFVVYSVASKQKHLGVKLSTVEEHGLTSEEVALEMARGALARSEANVAVANTGVADDTDPSMEPGTQTFAWVFRTGPLTDQAFTETRTFSGSRNEVRIKAADYALQALVEHHRSL